MAGCSCVPPAQAIDPCHGGGCRSIAYATLAEELAGAVAVAMA